MKLPLTIIGILFSLSIHAQYRMNFGLREKQDKNDLPRSNASIIFPSVIEKPFSQTKLIQANPGEWIISGGWRLIDNNSLVSDNETVFNAQTNGKDWYDAIVPGTVLTTLVERGVYPDPYFGINNLAIPDSLCRKDWWYRVNFKIPEHNLENRVWLVLNGINYRADVWLNGRMAGEIAGAFKRGEFDITPHIVDGDNILAIHIFPPNNPGIPHEESPRSGPGPNGGQLCLDGPTFISSEGWDWVPGIRDRNIGIWQDVRLHITGPAKMLDPQVITDLPLPDISQASVRVTVPVINYDRKTKSYFLEGSTASVTFSQSFTLEPGELKIVSFSPGQFDQLMIKNPRLWWPNGYGQPELYDMTLTLKDESGAMVDFRKFRYGIREFTYELSVDTREKQNQRIEFTPLQAKGKPVFDNIKRREIGDGVAIPSLRDDTDYECIRKIDSEEMGPYLVIKVNGIRVFCKGGNWGMDDAMKRVSREHLEPYFKLHRDAGFTMIRNWTGESTEEIFYELADEYGLLVWNDFWLSTEGYNLDVNDYELFMQNATDVVKRFRNHPSIAIWCPRNEGYASPELEPKIASMLASEDGTRYYSANSRYMNLRPSGPWHYFNDASDYFTGNAAGFNTELGTPSIPTAASMRKMMAPEDVWPVSDVWYYHDLHNGQKEYMEAIANLYGNVSDLESFCSHAQMINYDSHRAMFESWNSRMWNNTSGILLWMTHPAWPSTVWQVYSWDYETFGSYFGSRKACEPVHVQMNLHDNKVIIVNTSLSEFKKATVAVEYFDLNGKNIYRKEITTGIRPNSNANCFTPDSNLNLPGVFLARLTLKSDGKILSLNDYWKRNTSANNFTLLNSLPKVKPAIGKIRKAKILNGIHYEFEISNHSKSIAIAVKLNARDIDTGKIILPAYFSDGYFNLLPGESRIIQLELPYEPGNFDITTSVY